MSTTTVTGAPTPDDNSEIPNNVRPLRPLLTGGADPGTTDPHATVAVPAEAEVEQAGEIVDAEIVDDSPAALVDTPTIGRPSYLDRISQRERRPILPEWTKSWADTESAMRAMLTHVGHTTAFHAVRAPWYVSQLALRSPIGAGRMLRGINHWVTDAEGRPVRSAMARAEDADQYLKLSRQRDARVRLRTIIMLGASALGFAGALTGWFLLPTWVIGVCIFTAVVLLGFLGAPADKPIITRAVVGSSVRPLTSEVIVHALSVLGISRINQAMSKDPKGAIAFTAPITRDGPGWRADIDLPPGAVATDVIDRRANLAAALGRPLGCVWPDGNTEVHPGRLVLWVGDQDMASARQPAWPLAKSGTVDLFRSVPFGTDQRGRWVDITLMFVSMIIGAVPRMGKTFALREVLLMAALDPRAEVHAYDLKGTGDLSPLAQVAHRYRAGDDDEDIAYALADLRALRDELRRRAKVIRELPKDLCPENKVTPELASNKSLGLHPIVIGVDECQVWFEHPKHGGEFEEIATDIVKRGPALGMVLVLATQRPDAKSIPTGISANAIMRFCLKVNGHTENDMVLGTSAHKNGVRATTLSRNDRGIGYLVGEGDDAKLTKTVYIDGPAADAIAARARAVRTAQGRLTGFAAGLDAEVDDVDGSTLLADIASVFAADEDKLWSETVVTRLAELRPSVYGPWAEQEAKAMAVQLAAALKPYGVRTAQVWGTDPATGKGANRRGIARDDITDAITDGD
jgi:S-DNA-T family DNA segregation ATPase FtsK/SpoIIIE